MKKRIASALALGLFFLLAAPRAGAAEGDLVQAKTYLKEHLKQLNRKRPFSDWEKQAAKARSALERMRAQASAPQDAFDKGGYPRIEGLARDVQELLKRRGETDSLIHELRVPSLMARIDGMFGSDGKRWDPDARLAFQQSLMPYEAGSLRPKTAFQTEVSALERDFRQAQTDWLFAFAQDYLGRRVEDHLRANDLARIEALYDDCSLQLDYWTRQIQADAAQARDQLDQLAKRFEEKKGWLRQNLETLLEVLNTDFLFSDLLEYARKQNVEFTIEVEDKIEASLKERNRSTVAPIQARLAQWKAFSTELREKSLLAADLAGKQESQAMARAEDERKERDRMEALKEEQRRMELEQKERFKQTLASLRTFTFKSQTAVELDDDSKKALSTKSGFLKTSYVRSGVNKLKVDKQLFNDTLALVQKFSVEEQQVDFSKMSLQERSNQSAYTYASPAGRTSQGDLENFVAEVALGSFSTYFSFLSYVAPARWSPGRVSWTADRNGEKINRDREFSYVDLMVDAHRKRSGGKHRAESTQNLPANMIVVFDPQGAIIRFQSFADVDEVSIRSGDLVGGKLHYKFLNYSTDRQHIYLNGIDPEMKVASPAGKS